MKLSTLMPGKACRHASGGFTLVELLTVICIVGVLAGILIAIIPEIRTRAGMATATSNLHQIVTAMNVYAADHKGAYPPYDNSDPVNGKAATESETWRPYVIWKNGYIQNVLTFVNPVNAQKGSPLSKGRFDLKGDCYFSATRLVYTEWKVSPKAVATPNRVTDDPNVPIIWDQRADSGNTSINFVKGPGGVTAGLFGYIDGAVQLRYPPQTPVRNATGS